MKKRAVKTPYQQIDIKLIVRNPEQPRRYFDQAELQELAESMKEHGMIQPVVVEERADSGAVTNYLLHDGERRWKAAQLAGLKVIPAIVHPPLNGTGPRERLERALVANVQRSEMHAIEEGLAYQRLITEFGYSIAEVSKRVGKHATRVRFCLDMLTLDPEIRQLMLERKLPCDLKVKEAFLSVKDPAERVKLAQVLCAKRKATHNMVIDACRRFNVAKGNLKRRVLKTSPAMRLVENSLPEWDALYQLGKVPPWPVVTESVMFTCDACPLRQMAGDATCGGCPLVITLGKMLEAVHGHKH